MQDGLWDRLVDALLVLGIFAGKAALALSGV
jgi:hypothetical protein